jgi:hypothetical protein
MKYEINKPGPLAQMSEAHAQVAMNPPAYGYMSQADGPRRVEERG